MLGWLAERSGESSLLHLDGRELLSTRIGERRLHLRLAIEHSCGLRDELSGLAKARLRHAGHHGHHGLLHLLLLQLLGVLLLQALLGDIVQALAGRGDLLLGLKPVI